MKTARLLATELGGQAIDLQSIPNRLPEADVVIASTAAQLPILGKGTVERALKSRKHRPILMVDLAVPRDIEPEVSELRDIYLYSVDDLQEIINANLVNRQEAADEAELILTEAVNRYRTREEARSVDTAMVRFRAHHQAIKNEELARALNRLAKSDDPAAVLEQLANQLTNKIIHTPSVQLREAAEAGDEALVAAVMKLHGLDQDSHE